MLSFFFIEFSTCDGIFGGGGATVLILEEGRNLFVHDENSIVL